jgi:sialate O-acetylesterase
MVIEKQARIWGWCENRVTVSFRAKEYQSEPVNGAWEVVVESDSFGGPFDMCINDVTINDVYVGHVFMLAGQSNMEMPASRVRIRYEDDFKVLIDNPRVRAFQVERGYDFNSPRRTCGGAWKSLSPETVDNFYAMTFYLSQKLENILDAPVGFIECAVGGTRIESWMSENSVRYESYCAELIKLCRRGGFCEDIERKDLETARVWYNNAHSLDIGIKNAFHSNGFDHNDWDTRPLTKDWNEDIGKICGVVWFRKLFNTPGDMVGKAARIFLGTVSDSDIVYINGEVVGQTEYKYPPRVYPIREGLLHNGENCIAVRVTCERPTGGFTKGKDYHIVNNSGCINLDGDWRYRVGCVTESLAHSVRFFNYPCGMYNAMLAPVLPHSVSAVLWYQGESNDQSPYVYGRLLARFIEDLRANYRYDVPFLAVQLPNFDAGELNENWSIIREQQTSVLNHINTAMIITDDIGEDNDLHPMNKRDVAYRLAEGVLYFLKDNKITSDTVIVWKMPNN